MVTAGCVLDGMLYISGGFKGPQRGHIDKLWCYRPSGGGQWQERASMHHCRSYHAMVVHARRLLVAGGVQFLGHPNPDLETFVDLQVVC